MCVHESDAREVRAPVALPRTPQKSDREYFEAHDVDLLANLSDELLAIVRIVRYPRTPLPGDTHADDSDDSPNPPRVREDRGRVARGRVGCDRLRPCPRREAHALGF